MRLIVSTTEYPAVGGEGATGLVTGLDPTMVGGGEKMGMRRNKSLVELRRRGWDFLEVKELSNKARKEILVSYLRVRELAFSHTNTCSE